MKNIMERNWERIELQDLFEAIDVEFHIDRNNKVWLNIEGKCAVRIGRADNITIKDDRNKANRKEMSK